MRFKPPIADLGKQIGLKIKAYSARITRPPPKDVKALERIRLKGFASATDAEYDPICSLEAFKKTMN